MPEEDEESRERLSEAIQAEGRHEGAVLIGWVLVSEWVDPEDQRWIDRDTNADSTPWQRQGYLAAALASEQEDFIHETEDD